MVTVTERGNNLSFIHRGDEVQFVVRDCVCVSFCVCVHVSGTIRECFFRYVNICVITSIKDL